MLKKLLVKKLLFLSLFLLGYYQATAQDYKSDFEKMYQKCTHTRIDSVHRLIVTFLRNYEVSFIRKKEKIQTPERFYKFCNEFKARCKQNNQKELLRRLQIIEVIDTQKHNVVAAIVAEAKILTLYDDFVQMKDYSAGLSCLLELGLIQGYYNNNLQAIKVLFFAEKFAKKYNLSKDIALQSILRGIGYYLWEFDIPALSIEYFKKSLQTGYTDYRDSLVILNGIGINYQKINDFKQSNSYFEEASRLALRNKNTLFNAIIEGNMAVTLFKTGNLTKAYQYALQDKNISLHENIWINAVGAMYWLIQIELKQNNFSHAKI